MVSSLRTLHDALAFQMALGGPIVPLWALPPAAPPETAGLENRAEAGLIASPEPATGPDRAPSGVPDASSEPTREPSMANLDLFGNELEPAEDPSLPPWKRIEALIPPDSPLHALATLGDVEAYVRDTILVPIDTARINPVFGTGDPNSDLMVIGEAPGADEDQRGEPFVGRAGQLLNKILQAVNFEREDVYIANILKSRPPGNRDPLPEEVAAHLPILYKQIALIQPRILLCVGKTSGNALLDRKGSLAALRGKFHDYYGLPLLVTYHPAALLRNPQWKRPTWEDMQLLRTRYDQLVEA